MSQELLEKLVKIGGFDGVFEMLEFATFDGVAPGICPKCESVIDVEPDQREGWCDECKTNTVQSCLVLADMI